MQQNIFGTDGIRGLVNRGYITPHNMIKLAEAISRHFHNKYGRTLKVIIGKDTRISCYMLEASMTAGFTSCGDNVVLLGPMPTPSISFLTKSMRADVGVMISASHNPYYDNGVKLFNSDGLKLTNEDEIGITNIFMNECCGCSDADDNADDNIDNIQVGKVKRLDDVAGRYIEFCKSSFPRTMNLGGIRMVLDLANGSTYKIAPQVFWELGADVMAINTSPNGYNINSYCGAIDPKELQRTVVSKRADIGIALDGDGDRIIVVDEKGAIVDGDYIIATIATYWLQDGRIEGGNVVATTMSNMQLCNYLESIGLKLHWCDVGDKYVAMKMLEVGAVIGGEKSGHIIPIKHTSTGDGIIAALQILAYLVDSGKKSSDISKIYKPYPQTFLNIKKVLSQPEIDEIYSYIDSLGIGEQYRVMIRKSGTENVTRVMIEGESCGVVEDINQAINRITNV